MQQVHVIGRNFHPSSRSGRFTRACSGVPENEELLIEFNIEPRVDQRNDGYDALRIGHRPLLQRERMLLEDQGY
jgi:hypothetical protein